MLRWFPRHQVATACFSCSPPDLNFLVTYFIFMYLHNNHCHRVTAKLQLINIIIIITTTIIIIIRPERHLYINLVHFLCHLTVSNLRCHLQQHERHERIIYVTQVVNTDYAIQCEYTCSVGVLHWRCSLRECQSFWLRAVIIIIIIIIIINRGRRNKTIFV